ncbi:hypothetical protein [Motilimonas sp. KMU-193]|uniref:hypothetical protein n=1 Tax=Motilimonas sp. KMU-193 TaxID=3388668 RepID=UPI00396B395E
MLARECHNYNVYSGRTLLDRLFRLYVLSCLYSPFFASLVPFPGLNLFDDLIFFAMIPICFVHIAIGFHRINLLVLAFPAYIALSSIISFFSGEDLLVLLLSLKNIKNLFLFVVLICLHEDHTDFVKRNVVFILYASVPVAVFQFLTVEHQDDITGLFGPKSTSLYSFLVTVYISAYAAVNGIDKVKWSWLLFIPVFLNETKITFLLFPLTLFLLFSLAGKIKLYHFVAFYLVGFLALILLDDIYFSLYGYAFSDIFTYEYLDSYLFDYTELHKDVPRFYRIYAAYDYLQNSNSFQYLFGHGLGAEYVGDQGGRLGSVAKEFEYTLLNQGTRIQIFQLLLDYGVLGTILFVGLLIVCFFSLCLRVKTFEILFAIALVFIMTFSLVYQNMFFTKQLSFLLFYFVYMALMGKFNDNREVI